MSLSVYSLTDISAPPDILKKSRAIIEATRDSVESFLNTYKHVRKTNTEKKSTSTTDEQQDILRAMLIFSAAGLDSCLKQLIRDVLPKLAKNDENVEKQIEEYCTKQIKNINDSSALRFLSKLLFSESTKSALIELYIDYLTGSSLQSSDELMKVLDALSIKNEVKIDVKKLKSIFNARNAIIHELDIDFNQARRIRFQRKQKEMIEYSNTLLRISDEIIISINEKL